MHSQFSIVSKTMEIAKIKNVRRALKEWNYNHFGNCHQKAIALKEKIASLQHAIQSSDNISLEYHLQVELDECIKRIEIHCKQKAKIKWLTDGDGNTKFFHLTIIIHARNNRTLSVN